MLFCNLNFCTTVSGTILEVYTNSMVLRRRFTITVPFLYRSGRRALELTWTIGPVDIRDGKGREIVSRGENAFRKMYHIHSHCVPGYVLNICVVPEVAIFGKYRMYDRSFSF